jgi:hypothetical protein
MKRKKEEMRQEIREKVYDRIETVIRFEIDQAKRQPDEAAK